MCDSSRSQNGLNLCKFITCALGSYDYGARCQRTHRPLARFGIYVQRFRSGSDGKSKQVSDSRFLFRPAIQAHDATIFRVPTTAMFHNDRTLEIFEHWEDRDNDHRIFFHRVAAGTLEAQAYEKAMTCSEPGNRHRTWAPRILCDFSRRTSTWRRSLPIKGFNTTPKLRPFCTGNGFAVVFCFSRSQGVSNPLDAEVHPMFDAIERVHLR